MHTANERANVSSEMNVTPMLDVVLVLLVIVILAALPMNVLSMQLPITGAARPAYDPIVLSAR